MEIVKGIKFEKRLAKGESCICEVVALIDRIDRDSKEIISTEIWAKSDTFGFGKAFEVSRTTIIRGFIK